jgi:hypothetical protein
LSHGAIHEKTNGLLYAQGPHQRFQSDNAVSRRNLHVDGPYEVRKIALDGTITFVVLAIDPIGGSLTGTFFVDAGQSFSEEMFCPIRVGAAPSLIGLKPGSCPQLPTAGAITIF